MSYFDYASVVWSADTSNCNISRLNTLHRRAIKIISNEIHIATDQKLRNLFDLVCQDLNELMNELNKYSMNENSIHSFIQIWAYCDLDL